MLRFATLAAACVLAAGAALAHGYKAGELEIGHPWSRATAPGAPVAGGYMTITNTGAEADRLVGGSAPFAGRVEIHEMTMQDDVMRMRELEGGLEIAPGETVELRPGGFHVMFMDLKEPLVEGESVPATLVFEKAGTVEVEFAIESMGARGSGHDAHGAASGGHKH